MKQGPEQTGFFSNAMSFIQSQWNAYWAPQSNNLLTQGENAVEQTAPTFLPMADAANEQKLVAKRELPVRTTRNPNPKYKY